MQRLVWYRSDLRTHDHTALLSACAARDDVIALFVLCPEEWRGHDWAPCKIDLLRRTLPILGADLARLNIPLLVRVAQRWRDVPGVVAGVAREHRCEEVHANTQYEVNEQARDADTDEALRGAGCTLRLHHDQCAIEPGAVRTQTNTPFTVFTPFKKRWLAVASERGGFVDRGQPSKRAGRPCAPDSLPECFSGFESSVDPALWPAGEHEARQRLARFCQRHLTRYREQRDFPARDGTSTLSPCLALGMLSPRQCLHAAAAFNDGLLDGGDAGTACWISELVWREFYKHVLFHFPRVCKGRAFKPATESIAWSDHPEHLAAWCAGRTGCPIVDAAMRCLASTGWMHNRLRMVTAMYLTKDLLIDWRLGERHFMRHLIDGDLSQNNGGWQWSASTGTDAAPYFRIFNPTAQSRRFDPDGTFIRRWVPELAGLSGETIHAPHELPPLARARLDYPAPIVDHTRARARVLEAFKALQG